VDGAGARAHEARQAAAEEKPISPRRDLPANSAAASKYAASTVLLEELKTQITLL
jgi:hypothetical protein